LRALAVAEEKNESKASVKDFLMLASYAGGTKALVLYFGISILTAFL